MKYFKLKFLTFFLTALLAFGVGWAREVTDVLNQSFTGVEGTSYSYWSNTGTSGAVYSGATAAGFSSIQMRASNSAIVTTKSGGKVKSITVTWNEHTADGRTLNIYCNNTAYTNALDFSNNAPKDPDGTIVKGTSTTLSIDNDYSYIAIKSDNGALYLDKIEIVWEVPDAGEPVTVEKPVFDPEDGATFEENLTVTLTCATTGANIQYSYNNEYFTNYTEPIVIDETTTIYAKAVLGEVESEVVSATYTKEAAPQPIGNEYVLVKDIADLAAGKHIIFVNKENAKAMSSTQNTNNRAATDITINSDIATATEATEIFTLEKDGDYWLFKATKEPGYIYAAGANSNNYLRTEEEADNKAQATVEIASDGEATVTFNMTGRNLLRYNSGSDLFSCYASGQLPVYIFIEKSGDTPQPTQVATPTFNPAQGEYTEAQNVTITCATEDAVIHYTVDGTNPTADSPVYAEAIAVGETTTIKAIAMKEGMTNSEIATATYTINIPSGDGKIYVKLTNPELTPGTKYIFVYEGEQAMAMGAFNSNNTKCNPVKVTINDNEVNIAGKDDIIEFTAGEGPAVYGSDIKQYTLALPSGQYLAYKSGTDFKTMETVTNYDTEAFWRIKTHDSGYSVYNASSTGRSIQKNTSTNMFGPYAEGQDLVAIYVEKKDEPVVEELTVALDPAEKTYTVGEVAKIMVNVKNGNEGTLVSYKINDGEDQDYNAETGIVLPNDKAKEYTIEVYATDGDREATATGTYSFTAAPAFDITLTPNKVGNYTVGDNAVVTVAVDKYIGKDYLVTYTIGDSEEQIDYNAETGIVLPNDKAGDVTVKVYVTDGYEHVGEGTATATYHFDAAPAIVVTLDPASGNYYLGEEVKVTVTAQNTIGDYEVTYKIGDGEELDYEDGITITSDQEGTVNLTVTVVDGYHDGVATATGAYTFAPRPVATMPVFSLVGGTYGEAQQLTITAEDGATILYSTDGSEPTTVYTDAIALGEGTTTVKAIATLDGYTNSPVATATYIIEIPAELPDVPVMKGYFQIKNNGNGMYANIAGRKTLNFTDAPADKAGTVIWLETNDKGQVQSIRSQAADLQGYANRAMRYVPEIVELVADKLNADGEGNLLGETGLKKIMEKFNESFDHHLYVEQAGEGWRLYGKTPSMQPVVDFYRENTAQVEAKLPMLESFINSALNKLKEKIGGQSVFTEFKLLDIWEKMGGTLTKPVDEASIMAFYREVLNNKNYVWDFAYQTAMIYVNNLTSHDRWSEVEEYLGEYAQYIDKIDQIRPDFKYYVVADGNKPDFISEGNVDIKNNAARTIWTLEDRTTFTVNIPANAETTCDKFQKATTLYTDFAYELPEGVTAYKVTDVVEGTAITEALSGVIPAQTPVLLMAAEAGDKVLTLSTEAGTAVTDNLLVGPDYLINTYKLTTPQVEGIFNMIKEKLGEDFYNTYVKEYEHLMYLNSGTVNNKYFWGLKEEDVKKCTYLDEEGVKDYVVRGLEGNAFVNNKQVKTNKAFLVSEDAQIISLNKRGDVNHDGKVNIKDVTDLIDRLLDPENTAACPICSDFNLSGKVDIKDVTDLIDVLLTAPYAEQEQPSTGSQD